MKTSFHYFLVAWFLVSAGVLKCQNNWTWVNGSFSSLDPAFHGTLGVSSPSNNPGGRLSATSWSDNNGNLWLYGGQVAGGSRNDLWKYNISTNLWTWMSGNSAVDATVATSSMGVPTTTSNPGTRRNAVGWTDNNNNLWLFGGYGINGGLYNNLWKYNISTNEWTFVKGMPAEGLHTGIYGTQGVGTSTTSPGVRYGSVGYKDNAGNLWLYGGYGLATSGGYGLLGDLWKYDISTNIWTWMKGVNFINFNGAWGTPGVSSSTVMPGGRWLSAGTSDLNGDLWLFGGEQNSGYYNDLWKYNTSSGNWTWVRGSSTTFSLGYNLHGVYGTQGVGSVTNTPGSRREMGHNSLIADNYGNLLLFGGAGYASTGTVGNLNDLWKYKISTNEWTWVKGSNTTGGLGTASAQGVSSSSNTPGHRNHPVSWRDNSGNFWIYGGFGSNTSGSAWYSSDLWKFDPCDLPANPVSSTPTLNLARCNGLTTTLTASSGTNTIKWYASATSTVALTTGSVFITPTLSATGSPTTQVYYSEALSCGPSLSRTAITITVNPSPTISVNSGSICAGDSFTLSPAGATSYTISGGSAIVSPTISSSFTVSGSNSSGCVSAANAISNVTAFARPVIAVNSGSICSGKTFTISPTGASTYTYSGGSAFVNPTSNTNYSVTGTSTAGCLSSNTAVATVTVHSLPVVSVNSGSICSGKSFTMIPSGASTYTFSNGSPTVAPSSSASYSVTGTSTAGCVSSNTAIATVTVYAVPVVSVNSGSICSGKTFTMIPSGASSYTFSNGSSTVSPTTSTNYSITGTSTAGCVSTNTAIASVTVNSVPVIAVNSGTICNSQVFTMVPSGASTYTFSSGSSTVNPSANASYSVVGTSAQGCVSSNTAVASVTVYAQPIVSVNSGTICAGKVFTMVPAGASTYTFSNGSSTVSPTSSTSYSLTGTSSLGCISSNTAVSTITVHALPVVSVNSGSICSNAVFTMVPTGASTYTFSNGSATVSPLSNTSYSVTGTSTAGCLSSNTAVATVTVYSRPIISVNSGSICSGQVFTIAPTGALTYTVLNNNFTVSPTSNTSYSVIGTNSLGCMSASIAMSSVTVHSLPVITVNSGTICAGGIFTMTPSGASSYNFSNGSNTVMATSSADYSVTGTSSLGCVSMQVISSLTVHALPVISANSGSICSGQVFTINASGAAFYSYSGGSSTVMPVQSSTYSIAGTSTAGCISATPAIIAVTVNTLPVISVNSGTICAGQVFIMAPNGAASYTFSSGSATVSPASNTNYTVTGTTAEGCISQLGAVAGVTVNPLPVITVNSGSICAGQVFTIIPTGAASYTYAGGSGTVSPVTNTNYAVTGSDALGCISASAAISSVTVHATPVIIAASSSQTICAGQSTTLTVTGASSYSWSSGSVNDSLLVSPAVTSTYVVTGTNVNGCSNAISIVQVVDACTGINNESQQTQVSVYPNPNSGEFIINISEPTEAVVINYLGQVVLTSDLNIGTNKLEIKNQPNGIYIIILQNQHKQNFTTRLIKY